jgi:hypothetical protein
MKKGFLLTIVVGFTYIARNMVRSGGYEIFYKDSSIKNIFKL